MSATKFLRPLNFKLQAQRNCCAEQSNKKGLVLGAYESGPGCFDLTPSAIKYDIKTNGLIAGLLNSTGGIKLGKARIFHNVPGEYYAIALAGAGPDKSDYDEDEVLHEDKENVRIAAGIGARVLHEHGVNEIHVEAFKDTQSAAEGSELGTWSFQQFKRNKKEAPKCQLYYEETKKEEWYRGKVMACAQNDARWLEEMPPNKMTPSKFAREAIRLLCPYDVQVEIRDRDWMESKGFKSFLSMCRGTCEAPLLVELSYCGGSEDMSPIALAGKGVTFDSGGICLRKCKGMSKFRADLAGGAVVIGIMKACAQFKIPLNIKALIPLCENMPGGSANKPGDLFVTMNNKSITMLDTSKEGRVSLADSLEYMASYKTNLVMSIATLTEGIKEALGAGATGVFSTSKLVWKSLEKAGAKTGDRVWRMPFWKYYCEKLTTHPAFDVKNIGDDTGGSPCVGAMFLLHFAPPVDFVHFDITGTGMIAAGDNQPYLKKGLMSGRPVRTIVEFLDEVANSMSAP